MIKKVELGSVPYNEVAATSDSDLSAKQNFAYIRQLYRILSDKGIAANTFPKGFAIVGKAILQGQYYIHVAVCRFNDDDLESCRIYKLLKDNLPALWDDEAKALLKKLSAAT